MVLFVKRKIYNLNKQNDTTHLKTLKNQRNMNKNLLQKLFRLLSSLRLAAFNLLSLFVIVFFGTLMQSHYGIIYVQDNIFRSWFVWLSVSSVFQIPVFLGGASISVLLFVNLMFSGVFTRSLRFNKLGITLTHAGVAFFVLSEVITAHFSKETQLQLLKVNLWLNHK